MKDRTWGAWLAIAVAIAAVAFADQIADVVGEVRAYSVYGALGIALGLVWFARDPQPLAERLRLPALLLPFGLALGLLPGTEVERHFSAPAMGAVGILAGLVLAETRRGGSTRRDRDESFHE